MYSRSVTASYIEISRAMRGFSARRCSLGDMRYRRLSLTFGYVARIIFAKSSRSYDVLRTLRDLPDDLVVER
jgi:hypothetical protein